MRTPVLEHFARFGFAVYGAVHLVIAWLAVRIATGDPPREGDQGGAFKTIADQPAGRWLVIAAGVGLASLAIWQGLQAVVGHRNESRRERTIERLTSAARAVVYAVLTYTAFSLLAGNSTPKGDQQQAATARLMAAPGGRWLVGAVGVGIAAFGIGYAVYGLARRFEKHLPTAGRTARWLGVLGFTAKGAAYTIVGILVVAAAVTYDPSKSRGLDMALRTMAAEPYGRVLLLIVAAGVAAYGFFAFAEARHHAI